MAAFAKLIHDPKDLSKVTLAFERIIRASLESHPVRHLTDREITRRFEMCAKIFESLRSDLKWSIDRILDKLPSYLGCELDGSDWKPDARTIWTPGDGVP